VGKGRISENGAVRPRDIKVGRRRFYFGKYEGTEVRVEGEELLVMREKRCHGRIRSKVTHPEGTIMAAKEVQFSDSARERLFRGVNILANAVKATLRPEGPQRGTSEKSYGARPSRRTAFRLAKEIELKDRSKTWEPRC